MQANQPLITEFLSESWAAEFDVVIIGSGFSGLCAALEASQAGASVIVIEKRRNCGGNSIVSNGELAVFGSPRQKDDDIQDSPELMAQDMLKAGRGRNDPALVKLVSESSRETLEWTINELGVVYQEKIKQSGGHSVPRCYTPHNASGSAIIKPLLAKVEALGVEIRTQMKLTKLLGDADGLIEGVEIYPETMSVEGDDQPIEFIKAKKAVVIATGGFSGDVHFRSQQNPLLTEDVEDTNRPGTTAEVMVEAIKMGANTVDLDCIQLAPWGSPDEKSFGFGALFASYAVSPYGVLINPKTGTRFINELSDRKARADAIIEIGQPCIGIADTEALKSSSYAMRNPDYDIDTYIQRGVVKRFTKIEDIAESYNIPAEALRETLKNFNDYVSNQADPEFEKPFVKEAKPIQPPYYTVRIWPKVHYTMGGLKINTKAQVVDLNDKPIKRLYAAGEVTGGIHGASRLSNCATTECLVFGRIADRQAAAEDPRA